MRRAHDLRPRFRRAHRALLRGPLAERRGRDGGGPAREPAGAAGHPARGGDDRARARPAARRADRRRAITPRWSPTAVARGDARAREARASPSTCGVSINNLTLNEIDVGDYRTFLKLNPPLRGEEERLALVEALAAGLIDVIVSDHDPQDVETKRLPFGEAAAGAIGRRDDAFGGPAAGRRRAHLTLPRLFRAMSLAAGGNPAGCPPGGWRSARPPTSSASIPSALCARSRHAAFALPQHAVRRGAARGRVKLTLVAGNVAHE